MAKSSEDVAALAAEQLATIRDMVVRDALTDPGKANRWFIG